MPNVAVIILAGGQGERLNILAQERAKPAIPFATKYRIIDFSLSNCVNSGLYNIAILTQYQPRSLADHIGMGTPWGLHYSTDRKVKLLQPYLAREPGRDWYKGTADAVYQNLGYIEEEKAELVLILSGDHVYKMDYAPFLKFHENKKADVTLAVTRMPKEELHRFGTVTINKRGEIVGFEEKVQNPRSNLVSMGVYLFRNEVLHHWLVEDARSKTSKHDFGKNIFPKMLGKARMFAYVFNGYWRDIGTVHTYWQANMDLFTSHPDFLTDPDWPIRTQEELRPPTMIRKSADVTNSLVAGGSTIEGRVEHSVLSPGVRIEAGAIVRDSIIMSDTTIGRNSVIDFAILDKEVIVGSGCYIGFGNKLQANQEMPEALNTGITIIGKRAIIPPGTKIGRNCVIYGGLKPDEFPGAEIPSGETLKGKLGLALSK